MLSFKPLFKNTDSVCGGYERKPENQFDRRIWLGPDVEVGCSTPGASGLENRVQVRDDLGWKKFRSLGHNATLTPQSS